MRVLHSKRHAASAGSVFFSKVSHVTAGFIIDNEIDAALAVQRDVLGAMPGHGGETQHLENRFQYTGLGGSEFYEFKSIQAHRVFK